MIRTIYLYLFALVGLALLIVGVVRFIDMGLKAFIFTKADEQEKLQQIFYYPMMPPTLGELEKQTEGEELTKDEKAALKSFLKDYKRWKEKEGEFDYLVSKRQKETSNNLAMILVGLPLYLYHWRTIKREIKEKE